MKQPYQSPAITAIEADPYVLGNSSTESAVSEILNDIDLNFGGESDGETVIRGRDDYFTPAD